MKNKTVKVIATVTAVVVALVGICVVAYAAASSKDAPAEEVQAKIIVETIYPSIGDLIVKGEYVGTVEPGQQMVVYPKASAEVLTVNFNVGDRVEAGDVLFELDSTALQSTIAQSQASVGAAQAKAQYNLEMAQKNLKTYEYNMENGYDSSIISAQSNVSNAEAAVRSAEIQLETANATLYSARRTLRDFRDENGDYDDDYNYDQQERKLRDAVIQAELGVENAQINLEKAQNGVQQSKESLEATETLANDKRGTAQDSIRQAQLNTNFNDQYIAIERLKNDINNYTAVAPISGIIEQRGIEPYQTASPGVAAYVISNKDAMTVSFQVSEATWENMRVGDKITVEKQGQAWPGTIAEISTMVNVNGGLYTIKATVENAPFHMNTGSTIKVYAEMQKAKNAIILPIDAVYYDSGVPYVYLYEDGVARKTVVETGIADTGYVTITSGLETTDLVITTWSATMFDGVEVVLLQDVQNGNLQLLEVDGQMEISADAASNEQAEQPSELENPANEEQSEESAQADASGVSETSK